MNKKRTDKFLTIKKTVPRVDSSTPGTAFFCLKYLEF